MCILHLHVYRHALLLLRLCMSKCTPRCVALWPAEWSGAISTFERGRGSSGRPQSTSYTFPILRVGHLWRVVVRSHFRIEVEGGGGRARLPNCNTRTFSLGREGLLGAPIVRSALTDINFLSPCFADEEAQAEPHQAADERLHGLVAAREEEDHSGHS